MITAHDLELVGARLFDSCDVDEARERISQVMQPHHFEPLGPSAGFNAQMDFVDLDGLGLGAIRFGKARVRARHLENYHLVVLCTRGTAVVRYADQDIALDQRRGACLSPGAALDAEFSSDCQQFVVRIDSDLFKRHTGVRNPILRPTVDLRRPEAQAWLRILWSLTGCLSLASQRPALIDQYQALLLRVLLEGIEQPLTDEPGLGPSGLRRAEAFIRDNARHPLQLEEISRAAGLSSRTLQSHFRQFRNTSPMTYLRDVRLDRVHRRLTDALCAETITQVAFNEGFAHLGRFSCDYANRFGLKPSDTTALARARGPRIGPRQV